MSLESLEEMLKKMQPSTSQVEVPYAPVTPEAVARSEAKAAKVLTPQEMSGEPTGRVPLTHPKTVIEPSGAIASKDLDALAVPEGPAPKTYEEEQREKIASMLSQEQTKAASPTQPSGDYAEISRQIEEFKTQQQGGQGIHWAEMLGMAIPVALGAGVGQLGAGAKSSGAYGIKRAEEERKKQTDLNKMITDLQGKLALAKGRSLAKNPSDPNVTAQGPDGKPYDVPRSVAMKLGWPTYKEGSFQTVEYDDEGKPRLGAFDKKRGEFKTFGTDPLAANGGKDSKSAREERLASEFQTRIKLQTRDKLNQDSDFKVQKTRISSTSDAINILNQRNPIGDAGVTTIFAKGIFGDVGNITQDERAAYIGNPMLEQTFKRLYDKYLVTGKLEESDRADLTKLAVAMRDHATLRSREIANNYIKSTGAVGIDPTEVINPLLNQKLVQPSAAPEVKTKTGNKTVDEMSDAEIKEFLKSRGKL
jgi:hypothetical protein